MGNGGTTPVSVGEKFRNCRFRVKSQGVIGVRRWEGGTGTQEGGTPPSPLAGRSVVPEEHAVLTGPALPLYDAENELDCRTNGDDPRQAE